jgi:hypothetical protein
VRRFKIDRRGATVVKSSFPARDADAPFVSRFQSRKAPLRNRCDKVIAVEHGKIEELARNLHADRMLADIFGAGAAKTVSVKSGHWIAATTFQVGP